MKWINTICGYFVGQNMSIHDTTLGECGVDLG